MLLIWWQEKHLVAKLSGGLLAWLPGWSKMQICIANGTRGATVQTVSFFSKIEIAFTFLVIAYPLLGRPGQKAIKWLFSNNKTQM